MLHSPLKVLFSVTTLLMLMFHLNVSTCAAATKQEQYIPRAMKDILSDASHGAENKKMKALVSKIKSKAQSKQIYDDAATISKNEQTHIKTFFSNSAKALNLGQREANKLYYFISFSMPKALIKAYLLDATWNGGVVVLRGVSPHETLVQFVNKRIMPLIKYKGPHARIVLDPNLFEQFAVTKVPAIVVSTGLSESDCKWSKAFTEQHIPYQACQPAKSDKYWKIYGSMSTVWALRKLGEQGAPAGLFLNRMRHYNFSQGDTEKPLKGELSQASLPVSDAAIRNVLHEYGLEESKNGAVDFSRGMK